MNRHILADQEERVGQLRELAVAAVYFVPRLREAVCSQTVNETLQREVAGKKIGEKTRHLVAIDAMRCPRFRANGELILLILRLERDGFFAMRLQTVETQCLLEKRSQEETLLDKRREKVRFRCA